MEAIAYDTGFTTLGQTLGVGASIFLGWNPQRLEKAKIYANRIRNTRIATTRMEIKRLVEVDILQC